MGRAPETLEDVMTLDPFAELLLVELKERGDPNGFKAFWPLADIAFELGEPSWQRIVDAAAVLQREGLAEVLHKLRGSAARITPRGIRHVVAAPWMDPVLTDIDHLMDLDRVRHDRHRH